MSRMLSLLLLTIIVVLGAFLRFYKLAEIPSGFYVDEAAIGYNAYSVIKTGADEYGKTWPIFLRSYNAYSSPMYMYLTTFAVSAYGLSIWSTRFLSALVGSMSIVVVYLILKNIDVIKSRLSVIATVTIFTISPWSIFFSRGAFEANLAFLFLCVSVLAIFKSKERKWLFVLAVAILSISTYAYQAQRLIAVFLTGYSVFWVFRPKSIRGLFNKFTITSAIVFVFIQIPQILIMTKPAFGSRAGGLFYKDDVLTQSDKIPLPYFVSYLLSFIREFGAKFVSYLSPRSLFHLPDPDTQRSIPELSAFYSWVVIPFLVGIYQLLKLLKREYVQFVVALTIITILPAALTTDPFSTLRSLGLLLPVTIIITMGIDKLISYKPKITCLTLLLLIVISLIQLWRSYFVLFPTLYAKSWDYGYRELVQEIETRPDTKILIDENRNNPSYIKLAFFMQLDPEILQQSVDMPIAEDYYGGQEFVSDYQFQNIEVRNLVWDKDIYDEQLIIGDTLAISDDQAKEHELTKVFQIFDPSEKVVFAGFVTNPHAKCQKISFQNKLCDPYLN
ncbi:hypothetical protein ACFL2C_00765 [Patescibacteria group bacterium]